VDPQCLGIVSCSSYEELSLSDLRFEVYMSHLKKLHLKFKKCNIKDEENMPTQHKN
jgi:hypothetical protein